MQNLFIFFLLSVSAFTLEARQLLLTPSENSSEEIQEALIEMQPGDVLTLGPGEYFFEDGISLDVDDVEKIKPVMQFSLLLENLLFYILNI